MIKVGILGGDTTAAGELVRLLINHPDVDLLTVASSAHEGMRIADFHFGLTGDTDLTFAANDRVNVEAHDVVFLCGEAWQAEQWMRLHDTDAAEKNLKIIDLTGAFRHGEYGMVYGLCEYNRKALVRGAVRSSLPSATSIVAELALFPLAKNQVLRGNIKVNITLPAIGLSTIERIGGRTNLDSSTRMDPIAPAEFRPDSDAAAREIMMLIRALQPGFQGNVTVTVGSLPTVSRVISARVTVPCSEPIGSVKEWYASAYDDHNFAYAIGRPPRMEDVCNTNKCLIHVIYPDIKGYNAAPSTQPSLEIDAMADSFLKGGAGNAVHVMNLLFGLSERTGLALKSSSV